MIIHDFKHPTDAIVAMVANVSALLAKLKLKIQ